MPDRVELRGDGWYDVEADLYLPLLWGIYGAGSFGARALPAEIRSMRRRIVDLERRGA